MKTHHLMLLCTLASGLILGAPQAVNAAPPSQAEQAKAKENKADQTANSVTDREVIQALEHIKKQLESEKGKDPTGHRAGAILHIQEAMGDIRAKTSKPGH